MSATDTPAPLVASAVTVERLQALQETIQQRQCTQCEVLLTRAKLAPRVRLAVNLKSLLTIFAEHTIDGGVLAEGLAPAEKAALVELQRRGASVDALIAAHGVLNVHERDALLHMLRGLASSVERRGDSHL